MKNGKEGSLVLTGIGLGIVIAVAFLAMFPALVPGTGAFPSPGSLSGREEIPAGAGIGGLSSGTELHAFLSTHTESATPAVPEMVPMTVPTTVQTLNGTRGWRYDVDTTSFKPEEYIVKVSAITHDATAMAIFDILPGPRVEGAPQVPNQAPTHVEYGEYYIAIDPVGDYYTGEKFAITGTTNLPAGDEMLIEVVSSSFRPTDKTQSGEFSGSTGTIRSGEIGGPSPFPTAVPTTAGREYSATNVQVRGVDEADIVKTDGTNIYVVSGNELHIVRAYPAENASILSTTAFAGEPISLYLYGDRLALICRDERLPGYWRCEPGRCGAPPGTGTKTVLYIFSVKDPSSPGLEREVVIDGRYKDSRMIGQLLYFLTSTPVNPNSPDITFPSISDGEKGIFTPAAYYLEGRDRAFAFTTIGSVALGDDAPVTAKTFLVGTAGTVYVSPTHLYIGIHSEGEPSPLRHVDSQGRELGGSTDRTDIYSFSLSNGAIAYDSAGRVDGILLNQYAMDEYLGNLRLATTVTGSGPRLSASSSTISVLDGRLKQIGTVSAIAPDERIYAARFMGDRLYLVTFRETDPFFVVDLADPAHLALVGTLKLPGFSDYLHPYDPTHIIGVGKTAAFGAVKFSLFDVSDISRPELVDSVELGDPGSDSEVLRDPKAFLFDKEKDLLVLPLHLVTVIRTGTGQYPGSVHPVWGGAYVFSVNPYRGFSLRGTVKHYDEHFGTEVPVKRALYIENTLYTISPDEIFMSDLGNGVRYLNSIRLA